MNKSDRVKLQDINNQFKQFNSGVITVTEMDTHNGLNLAIVDGYVIPDSNGTEWNPMFIADDEDKDGNLKFLDKIHEFVVLNLGYVLIDKGKKKWHTYAGCLIKTYPGEKGTCFLNINDNQGNHVKGFPINDILTVYYNEDDKSLVITFVGSKPAFKYSWMNTEATH